MQLWTTTVASPRATARTAREREAAGWDGMLVVDSQNLSGDPYVALAMAATATTRLGLGTGVTNNVTRPGNYGGYPLQRLPDALKTAVNTTRLAKLRRDLRKVMKHLGITSDDLET